MANSQFNAAHPTVGESGPGYRLPNQAAPLPRQWQLPPPQALVPRSQGGVQRFYPEPAGAGNWQQPKPSRWMERAILLGLWLLVMLTAIAIGLRMLDLSVMTATPVEPVARAHASTDAANAMRSAASVAARSGDSDPFNEIVSTPPEPEAEPVPVPVPVPSLMPATLLTSATTLATRHPAAPVPANVAPRASREPVCADAIRAMQLCPDQVKN